MDKLKIEIHNLNVRKEGYENAIDDFYKDGKALSDNDYDSMIMLLKYWNEYRVKIDCLMGIVYPDGVPNK